MTSMTAAALFPCAPDAETRDAYAAFARTIEIALGPAPSSTATTLGADARRALVGAICRPDSRDAWAVFVRAVAAYLEDLDSAIGLARDETATASRSELREILIVNDDLLTDEGSSAAAR